MHKKFYPSEKARHVRRCIRSLSSKLGICALLCAVFAICVCYIPQNVTYEYRDIENTENTDASAPGNVSETLRIIREKDGKIGIFRTDGSLIRTVNVDVSSLPDYDRQLLGEGIVASEQELTELIEGLTS